MEELLRDLHILSHLLERVIDSEALNQGGDNSFSKAQHDTLVFVQTHPGAHPSDLAKAFGITAPTVSNLLQRLERKGYIKKVPAPNDQRSVILELTPSGEALLATVNHARKAVFAEIIHQIPAAQQTSLTQGLEALLSASAQIFNKSQLCLQCGNAHTPKCVLNQHGGCGHCGASKFNIHHE